MRSHRAVWKRIVRGLAWLLGGTLTLLVVAYLGILLINWHDAPPSPAALRLAALYRDRPPVADADNAYIYVMGFGVAPNADPQPAGVKRAAWVHNLRPETQRPLADDPVPSDTSYRFTRPPAVQALSDACRIVSSGCFRAFEASGDVVREWTQSEKWLLDRYVTLLHHSGWLEMVPLDVRASLPAYATVFEGQKLLLAKAYLLADQHDAAGVRELLGDDVRFWRRVLASSDLLITKMIAVAALNRTFGIGNLVLRRLPANIELDGMPPEWRSPLSETERSLLRCFTGEWIFEERLLRLYVASGAWRSDVNLEGHASLADDLVSRMLAPLFQPQDASNKKAEMFLQGAAALNVPLEQLPKGLERAHAIFEGRDAGGFVTKLYNPVGNAVLRSLISYSSYGARVADVEGSRRVAVLAVELRSRRVDADKISPKLAASAIRAPYGGEPFTWSAEEQAIVFVGLEPSERGRHLFKY